MNQIKVTIGNNVKREACIIPDTTTLRKALEDAEIDYSRGTIHLDGIALKAGDMDKTFADMGVTEKCFLINVAKTDNA